MFTGIVQSMAQVTSYHQENGLVRLILAIPEAHLAHLSTGASIAVDGVCLTVVKIEQQHITFELIAETLQRTTLGQLQVGDWVNIERSYKVGDEIGGHRVSGHVHGMATIIEDTHFPNNRILRLQVPAKWIKYIFPKGFIALTGISLTVVDVDRQQHTFTVHLIPETLQRTVLSQKTRSAQLNFEVDCQTQTIVDTTEQFLQQYMSH